MQQLYFIKKGKLEWREVAAPSITSENEAIVRPFAVAKCDLDDAFLFNNVDLLIRIGNILGLTDPNYRRFFGNLLRGPFPFGHECVAEVTDIGDGVNTLQIGDIVSVPFQISCGSCLNCCNGFSSACDSVPPVAFYGFGEHLSYGGAMSDAILVPYADHMLTKIPRRIDPVALASLSDNIPDAYRHISALEQNPDQRVLIVSGKAKSVGMYALIMAKAIGVEEVDFADNNPERLMLAEELNASNIFQSLSEIPRGSYDLVIDACSTQKGLDAAFRAVRNFGTVSSSGVYIRKASVSLLDWYAKGVTFNTGIVNARECASEILDLIDRFEIDFGRITTKTGKWENAIDAFLSASTKVVVTRDRLEK